VLKRGAFVGVAALLLIGCQTTGSDVPQAPLVESTLPSDALSQMEIAFIGTPRQSEIVVLLDEVLLLYDMEPSEANYRKAGDVLVALRRGAVERGCEEEKCGEMNILRATAEGPLEGLDFTEAAAFTSAALALE